jgi:membrane protease subunit HflC
MKKSIFSMGLLIAVGVIVFIGFNSLFITSETEQALVLRFGEPIGAPVSEPGLKTKMPFVDNVVFIDKRILDLDLPAQEVIASDQKRLVVDAFARYKITNPLLFYQAVTSVERANSFLVTALNSSLRRVLGESSFQRVVRDERATLMSRIREQVNQQAEGVGITVVDIKIRRADLPEQNSQAIFQRMQTERQREASEIRAQGAEAAQRIRSRADRDVVVLTAEANKTSEQVRGKGDGERSSIFATAFSQDADFFSFYRSMQAYEQGLVSGNTRLVLSPQSDFFRFFGDASPAARPNSPRALGAAANGMPRQ